MFKTGDTVENRIVCPLGPKVGVPDALDNEGFRGA